MTNAVKLPPHNTEAEQSILGSMLITSNAVFSAIQKLKPEDFYVKRHADIFEAMLELVKEQKPVDLVTTTERLSKMGKMQSADDIKYISDLTQVVPSAANVEYYIGIVEEKSSLRRLIGAADSILKKAYSDEEDAQDILNDAGNSIYQISVKNDNEALKPLREVMIQSYEQIGKAAQSEDGLLGIPTGFPRLDNMLAGLQGSQLIIIAGRPGMGKTSFAMDIIKHIGLKKKLPAAVFSLEMSYEQIGTRLMCSQAGIDMNKNPPRQIKRCGI